MKRILVLITIPLFLFACSNKKKGLLLFPALLGTTNTTTAPETSVSQGDSFSVTTVATDDTQVATGSGSTPAPTTVSATTTTTTPSPESTGAGFQFGTSETIPVVVSVTNESGPSAGLQVTLTEVQSTGESNVIGQSTTNSSGSVTIPVSVPATVNEVTVTVVGVNPSTGEIQQVTGSVPTQGGTPGSVVTVAPNVVISTTNFQAINGCSQATDSDCDGVVDSLDEFPSDATLTSTYRSGRNTIAFEDSYPKAGNADLNDHTSVFSVELDKTPTNKVKVLRAVATQIAKGPGHDHELRLKLDVSVGAKFEVSYVDGNGNPWNGCAAAPKYVANTGGDCTGGNLTADQLRTGLLVIPNAFKSGGNKQNFGTTGGTFTANDFVRGITSYVTVTFDEPVDLNTTKNTVDGHLNWFLATSSKTKGVFEQIYRPGYIFDSNGKDKYLDSEGFPWAIVVPGIFNHPTNGADIRKASTTPYAYFSAWAESNGAAHKDWYTQITNPSRVVSVSDYYTDNGFSAYLVKAVDKNIFQLSAGLILIGAAMGMFLKRKAVKN